MKVYVYAIARNESRHVRRWMESMGEADGVWVLDTGSEDGTAELLKGLGAHVRTERIEPWRFDQARNRALSLLPGDGDICVSTDLDEVFRPHWRQALEAAWQPGVCLGECRYVWSFHPDGSEGGVFYRSIFHSRRGFRWKYPVHEVLVSEEETPPGRLRIEGVQLEHRPEGTASHGQYLPLLELAVAEEPESDRCWHYLGREYMYQGRWEEAIAALRHHLALPSATWAAERCASLRFIARCEEALGRRAEAERALLRAVAETPGLREPWVELAGLFYRQQRWAGVVWAAERALEITGRGEGYICEGDAWGALPWDLASLGYWGLGLYDRAERCAREALSLAPGESRLGENAALFHRLAASGRPEPGTDKGEGG